MAQQLQQDKGCHASGILGATRKSRATSTSVGEGDRATYLCWLHCLAIWQLNSLAGLEPPKHGPLGHAQGRCLLGVEAAGRVGQVADVAAGRPLTSQWRHLQQIASLCM